MSIWILYLLRRCSWVGRASFKVPSLVQLYWRGFESREKHAIYSLWSRRGKRLKEKILAAPTICCRQSSAVWQLVEKFNISSSQRLQWSIFRRSFGVVSFGPKFLLSPLLHFSLELRNMERNKIKVNCERNECRRCCRCRRCRRCRRRRRCRRFHQSGDILARITQTKTSFRNFSTSVSTFSFVVVASVDVISSSWFPLDLSQD